MLPADILKRYRVSDGRNFRLADFDPGDTAGLDLDKDDTKKMLEQSAKRLGALQERLYADHRWAILIVLQGLDTAGKDGLIEHVMAEVNPQGCDVHPFKVPSQLEMDHDFLWRASLVLPRRGHLGIFNRSYYEEVLVVRVHPNLLETQGLPPSLITKDIWQQRYEDINAFELHLARSGTVPLKFFLNLSRAEQKKRLLARIDNPDKQWKFNAGDLKERALWEPYLEAYEAMIRATATAHAPWYVVPADHKWFTRLVVAASIVERLEAIDPQFPTLDDDALKELQAARASLCGGQ
jgi:PPK2 family polyphosphate:nucleotide phosphotransferase